MHALVQCASSTRGAFSNCHAEQGESLQLTNRFPVTITHTTQDCRQGAATQVTWVSTQGAPAAGAYLNKDACPVQKPEPLLAGQAEDVERLFLLAHFWF